MISRPGKNPSAKQKVAVALRYRRETESAPVVVATGRGEVADRIVRLAEESRVPVHEDTGLAEALGRLQVDQTIPLELYEAVAEVISFVYRIRPVVAA